MDLSDPDPEPVVEAAQDSGAAGGTEDGAAIMQTEEEEALVTPPPPPPPPMEGAWRAAGTTAAGEKVVRWVWLQQSGDIIFGSHVVRLLLHLALLFARSTGNQREHRPCACRTRRCSASWTRTSPLMPSPSRSATSCSSRPTRGRPTAHRGRPALRRGRGSLHSRRSRQTGSSFCGRRWCQLSAARWPRGSGGGRGALRPASSPPR